MKKKTSEIQKLCFFCENACRLTKEDEVLCSLKGIVRADYVCRRFRYDPLKRDPAPPLQVESLDYVDLDKKDGE